MSSMSRTTRTSARRASASSSCAAARRIEEFNEHFGTTLADDEFDTIAGLVMQQFGRVPRRGESVSIGPLEFHVLRTDRRRIESLRVVVAPGPPPAATDAR